MTKGRQLSSFFVGLFAILCVWNHAIREIELDLNPMYENGADVFGLSSYNNCIDVNFGTFEQCNGVWDCQKSICDVSNEKNIIYVGMVLKMTSKNVCTEDPWDYYYRQSKESGFRTIIIFLIAATCSWFASFLLLNFFNECCGDCFWATSFPVENSFGESPEKEVLVSGKAVSVYRRSPGRMILFGLIIGTMRMVFIAMFIYYIYFIVETRKLFGNAPPRIIEIAEIVSASCIGVGYTFDTICSIWSELVN